MMRMIKSRAFLNDHNSGDCFVDDVNVVAMAPITAGIGFDDVFDRSLLLLLLYGGGGGIGVDGIEEMGSVAGIGAGAGRLTDVLGSPHHDFPDGFSHGSAIALNKLFPVLFERSPFITPFGFDHILSTEPLQPRYEFLTLVACYPK